MERSYWRPETIACFLCGMMSAAGIVAAIEEGWRGIVRDECPTHTHLGYCPGCQEARPADVGQQPILCGAP